VLDCLSEIQPDFIAVKPKKNKKKELDDEKILTRSNKPPAKQEDIQKTLSAVVKKSSDLVKSEVNELTACEDLQSTDESKLGSRRRIRKKQKNALDP